MREPIKYCIVLFFVLMTKFLCMPSFAVAQNTDQGSDHPGNIAEAISPYKITSAQNLLLPGHLYCKSSGTSVEIRQTSFGIGNIISPPYFCYPFSGKFSLFHQPVSVSDFDWYPAGAVLKGKEINGVGSVMSVIPLWKSRGILAEITLENRSDREIKIPAEWIAEGQIGKSENWEWYPPFAMKSNPQDIQVKSGQGALEFWNESTIALIKSQELRIDTVRSNTLVGEITLKPGQKKSISLVVLIGSNSETQIQEAEELMRNPGNVQTEAFANYNQMLNDVESKVPKFSGSPQLEAFYQKGLLTFLTCRWDIPEFISSPWYAESGIDGGALNNYCWGIAYISRMMSMIDPSAVRKLLLAYATADLRKTYALNPADGKGMGVLYSYNYFSIARATHDYIILTGDLNILTEKIGQQTYLDYLYQFCLSKEDLKSDPELIDFGDNSNLLELKKTADYCHYTPSPNAERLLIYRYLSDLYSWLGKTTPDDLDKRAERLKSVFQSRLWDSKNNWLFSLDQQQQPRTAYSIQIFDVLRTGALTRDQETAVVSHLNATEFLSGFGVHSLAKTDEGYDVSDVDWGGPGVYAGDAPELMEDLLNAGFVDQGIDVLKRILWWGRFPYYPQAIRADRIGYREDGRPNEIAGLAATQSIVFGLFGISVGKDFVSINPISHSFVKGLSLNGLTMRNRKMDISVSKEKNEFLVKIGQKCYKSVLGKAVKIDLPHLSTRSDE